MSRQVTTALRRSRMIDHLRNRSNPVPVAELAQKFGVTMRTVLRDADALRADGHQITGSRGRGGGLSVVEDGAAVSATRSAAESPSAHPDSVHLVTGRLSTFVGRASELAELRAAYEDAEQGHGRVVVLAGEPGIGKTVLAQRASAEFAGRGALVYWGRSLESEGALPYWPWVQVIRNYAGDVTHGRLGKLLGDGAADIGEIVPEIFTWLPALERSVVVGRPESARFRLFRSLSSFFENASTDRPIVLVLEDLHRADAPSLLFLEFLAQQIGSSKILVIGTYRDVELGRTQPLTRTLAELNRQPGFTRMSLHGLTHDEVLQLLEITSGTTPDSALVSTLLEQTEGNPLFVSEMAILLLQRGQNGADGAGMQPGTYRIPEGIKEAIGQRLDRLPEAANQLLRAVSVLGRDFSLPEVRALMFAASADLNGGKIGEAGILQVLDEAVKIRLLENPGQSPDRFQFTHSLIRDTLYQELSALERVRLHRSAGDAIERLYRDEVRPRLATLAHHFFEAARGGQTDKAVDYAERAGHHATEMIAHEEAVRFFDLALDGLALYEQPDPNRRYGLLMARGRSLQAAGEYIEGRASFRAAFELAAELGEGEMCAEAAVAFETAGWHPGMHGLPAVHLLRSALRLLGKGDSKIMALTLASFGRALHYSGMSRSAMEVGDRAIEMARRVGDVRTLGTTLWTRLPTRYDPQDIYRRIEIAQEVMKIGEQTGEADMTINAAGWLLNDVTELGEAEQREEVFNTWRGKIAKSRDPMWIFNLTTVEVARAAAVGNYPEAERMAMSALKQGHKGRGLDARGIHGAMMFQLRREQGRLHEVAPALELFLTQRPTDAWRPGLTALFAELDREQEARVEFLSLAGDDFAAVPNDALEQCSLAYLADVCVYLRDRDNAQVLFRLLKPYEDRIISLGVANVIIGPAARYMGELATLLGWWDEAERLYEQAIAISDRMNAPTQTAPIRLLYGQMLQRRLGPGDRRRARKHLNSAFALANRLGMRTVAQRAAEALAEREPETQEARYFPAGLSVREVDVLRLLAGGLGNREIGQELFITPNTVANHVKRILQKTGASNRTEAAAFAVRSRLLES